MDHFPGDAGCAERDGSLLDGIVVGLALEVGFGSILAAVAGQIRPSAWSLPVAPAGLLILAGFAFALVASTCLEPSAGLLSLLDGRPRRRGPADPPSPLH
ncbi:hypothetical protein TA3x_000691 [Tundrisphaera sp. TA3]|uniref:hypothetical protein n=1 Tax=Tundrisphaera sp. TA3 TaxID=3435775 RepID=UPI003EB9C01B